MTTIDEDLMLLHRELRQSKQLPSLKILDRVVSKYRNEPFHSCPICGSVLSPSSLACELWECNGMFHGTPINFKVGSPTCKWCDDDGPFCGYQGYCLEQQFVEFGKPIVCLVGRIDDQSPRGS